jgi:hypothetical protein
MTSTTVAPAKLPISTPSANFSLSDPTTYITLLSIAGAIVSDVLPHFAAQAYVAPAATIAAAVVVIGAFLAKHGLAATLHSALTHEGAVVSTVTHVASELGVGASTFANPGATVGKSTTVKVITPSTGTESTAAAASTAAADGSDIASLLTAATAQLS